MQKTKALYDLDAYQSEFEATVLSCEEKEGKYQVVLDQTCFFPEQGGQNPDWGTLDSAEASVEVLDVQIQDGIIYHTCTAALPVGSKVQGKLEWIHRFNNMQQHSGEHILSGLIHGHYGYDNVGFHLGVAEVTMDFNGILTQDQVDELELEANLIIAKAIPIEVSYPDDETLKTLPYRSKKELEGPIRIVTIPGVDICACCAPHVRNTSEVGILKVESLQNYKGGVRLSISCGLRARALFRLEHELMTKMAGWYSTGVLRVPEMVEKTREEAREWKQRYLDTRALLLEKELAELPADEHVQLFLEEGADQKLMQKALNILKEQHSGLCFVLTATGDGGFRYLLGGGASLPDVRPMQKYLNENLGARGGGKPEMVQGSIANTTRGDLEKCFESLQNVAK